MHLNCFIYRSASARWTKASALKAWSLRSILLPTKEITALGHIEWTSGYHWILVTLLFWEHWYKRPYRRRRMLPGIYLRWCRRGGVVLRILLGQLYPWVMAEGPESEVDDPAVDFDGGGGVIEDSWLVLLGELVEGVARWGEFYLKRRDVLPTAPSPTITSLIGMGSMPSNSIQKPYNSVKTAGLLHKYILLQILLPPEQKVIVQSF